MRKKLFVLSLLMLLNLGLMAQDSDNMLNIVRGKQVKANLNGKGGVKFIANKPDYIIRTTFKDDAVCDKARKVGEHYEYELLLDISKGKSRVFVVSKKGSPISGKSDQLNINADEYRFFSIEEPGTLIAITTQRIDSKSYFAKGENPIEALIEIKSAVQLSEITTSELVKISQTGGTKGKDGTYNYGIVINAKQLPLLKEKVQKANDLYRAKDESASSSWTDEQWKELDQLRESRDNASNDYANAVTISLQGKNTNRVLLRSDLIEKLTPKDKLVCNIDLLSQTDTIIKEETFEEVLQTARNRYREYPQHMDFNFYDGAMTAYKEAMSHKNCPDAMRPVLQAEYDSIVNMRKWVNFYERAMKLAQNTDKGSKEEYKYLAVELKALNHLLKYHPEIEPLNSIRDKAKEQINKNPNSVQKVKRQRVQGKVSFADELESRPFSSLKVYASPQEKVDRSRSDQIGDINSDGTYSVLIPDHFSYIYVTGEKRAHYIGDGREQLDIIIR